jgi:glycerol-3-phosphate dehydrogenase
MVRFPIADSFRQQSDVDILVIGGGATGLGIAVQAALEQRKVVLVEARDFASGTSSRSSKMLHGGVRYLAQGHWALVRQALQERAIVQRLAPHLVQAQSFLVVQNAPLARWVTAIGLKLYQFLAGRLSLGPTQLLSQRATRAHWPLAKPLRGAVRYWDAQFEDARLALALAQTAHQAGALLRNHTQVTRLQPLAEGGWEVTLQDTLDQRCTTVKARAVVNATGVWVDALRGWAGATPDSSAAVPPQTKNPLVRPSQGVHVVVAREKLPLSEPILVPKTSDGRVLFVLPWLGATLIGTTDTPRSDAPQDPLPMAEEIDFLLRETQLALGVALTRSDIQSAWAGLRPLVNAGGAGHTAQMSREHVVLREAPGFVTVTGGKWTTYRVMAQDALQALVDHGDLPRPKRAAQTDTHPLYGAPTDGEVGDLHAAPSSRLLGSEAKQVLQIEGHDRVLGLGLTEAMVRHSARQEWAVTVEDMLARRWRVLFLDAQLAERMAPAVADILQQETGMDPQLPAFLDLCKQYQLS